MYCIPYDGLERIDGLSYCVTAGCFAAVHLEPDGRFTPVVVDIDHDILWPLSEPQKEKGRALDRLPAPRIVLASLK